VLSNNLIIPFEVKMSRKYNTAWESQDWAKGWLKHVKQGPSGSVGPNGSNEAFYYVCRTSLRADVNDLKRHASTKIHKQQAAKPGKKSTILNYATTSGTTSFNKEQKEIDMNLAVYIAYHRCIRSVDDLDEILRKIGTTKGSRLENLRLHRTKCSMLIKNVIAPALLKEIVNMSYKCQLYPIHTVAT
jgi:hypothetical protein